MKLSFMTFSTPELSLADVLAAARRYGYDGVEPRLDAGHAHGIEAGIPGTAVGEIRKRVADSGIALACLATSLSYADPAKTEEMLRGTRERVDLAGELGVPAIRVFGGSIPKSLTREGAVDLLVESLGSVADHAKSRGVTLCVETHDDWCNPAHVAAVMSRVKHPSIAVNWDVMHPVRTRNATIDESYQALRPWIRHVHAHDGAADKTDLLPIGQGAYDHRRVLELLKEAGYAGFVSGEWIGWEPYEVHLPRELATLRRYERELGA